MPPFKIPELSSVLNTALIAILYPCGVLKLLNITWICPFLFAKPAFLHFTTVPVNTLHAGATVLPL